MDMIRISIRFVLPLQPDLPEPMGHNDLPEPQDLNDQPDPPEPAELLVRCASRMSHECLFLQLLVFVPHMDFSWDQG